ncbi:very low-density lipoprotein receptor-like [Phymastichus coffea]|uniref:very low-density lipoprotein receptor-like n=1 Tax=Phymastichus coffea TaxID=108790 RepID=UPI00273AEB17|nr:very low-density lipoprotein receptor-like [Phymastichus coffea]
MKLIVFSLFLVLLFMNSIKAAEIKKTITVVPSATNDPKKANEAPRQSHCYSNQFECSNGQCIDSNLICNRERDCRDGSDESFSTCSLVSKMTTTTPRYVEINMDARPEFTCLNGEFLCTSGECILQSRICNGRHDCQDGSDEGSTICNSNKRQCLTTEFRCDSGECIHMELRCDGSNDCYDSSDEDFSLCHRIINQGRESIDNTHGVIPLEMSSTDGSKKKPTPCVVPIQPTNGWWKLHQSQCDSGSECNPPDHTRSMDPGTYLVYSCDHGFAINGSKDVLCGPGGQWIHEPKCDEIRCHELSSSTTEALCTWNNVAVSCEIPAPVGTTAQLKCREGFMQDITFEQVYKNVKCQADGKWNPQPIQCNKKPRKVKLILEGVAIFED